MRAKLFRNGRSQAVRLPAEFRFEGTEVEVHRDPNSGAVVLTAVRPSARDWLAERDRLLAEPGVREELDAFFDNLRDPSPPPERDWPRRMNSHQHDQADAGHERSACLGGWRFASA